MAYNAREQRSNKENKTSYIRSASVPVHCLSFPHSRPLDFANVERLKTIFKRERCLPDRQEHHIPALVKRSELDESWFIQAASGTERFSPSANFTLQCLRGQHRVEAAKKLSPPTTRWTVDFYDEEVSEETKIDLVEKYENENPPDDGEFYFKIRLYSGAFGVRHSNLFLENRWKARWLSHPKHIGKSGNTVLTRVLSHPRLVSHLDQMRYLRALWAGMRLGSIARLISLKCEEEILAILYRVTGFFYKVFEDNEDAMQQFTKADLEQLQGRAPGASRCQKEVIEQKVVGGAIWGYFDVATRGTYFSNLVQATQDVTIPCLDDVFKNLHYLDEVSNPLLRLVSPGRGESCRSAFERHYTHPNEANREDSFGIEAQTKLDNVSLFEEDTITWIQTSDRNLVQVRSDNCFEVGYRQLWLYAFRHHDILPRAAKPRKAGQAADLADKRALYEFGLLAYQLGFRSCEIEHLRLNDPDRAIVREVIEKVGRTHHHHTTDSEVLDDLVLDVTTRIQHVVESIPVPQHKNRDGTTCSSPSLYGKPLQADFEQISRWLFLPQVQRQVEAQGESLSSYFLARCLYLTLFGGEVGYTVNDQCTRDLLANGVLQQNYEIGKRHQQTRIIESEANLEKQRLKLKNDELMLEAKSNELTTRLLQLEDLKRGYNEREVLLLKEKKSKDDELQKLQANLNSEGQVLDKTRQEATNETNQLREKIRELEEERQAVEADKQELENKIELQEKHHEKERQNGNAEIQNLNNTLAEALDKIKQLKELITVLEAEKQDLTDKLGLQTNLEKEKKEADIEVENLKTSLAAITKTLNESNDAAKQTALRETVEAQQAHQVDIDMFAFGKNLAIRAYTISAKLLPEMIILFTGTQVKEFAYAAAMSGNNLWCIDQDGNPQTVPWYRCYEQSQQFGTNVIVSAYPEANTRDIKQIAVRNRALKRKDVGFSEKRIAKRFKEAKYLEDAREQLAQFGPKQQTDEPEGVDKALVEEIRGMNLCFPLYLRGECSGPCHANHVGPKLDKDRFYALWHLAREKTCPVGCDDPACIYSHSQGSKN